MIFKTDKGNIYFNPNDISATTIIEDIHWKSKRTIYNVNFITKRGIFILVYSSEDENKSKKILDDINVLINDKKTEKTYLDGFKDGTEYALKLIDKK